MQKDKLRLIGKVALSQGKAGAAQRVEEVGRRGSCRLREPVY
jgi:hypothetical protein